MTSTEGSPGRRPRMYVLSHPRALDVPPAIAHVAARAPAYRRDASPFPVPFPVSEMPASTTRPARRDAPDRPRVPASPPRARVYAQCARADLPGTSPSPPTRVPALHVPSPEAAMTMSSITATPARAARRRRPSPRSPRGRSRPRWPVGARDRAQRPQRRRGTAPGARAVARSPRRRRWRAARTTAPTSGAARWRPRCMCCSRRPRGWESRVTRLARLSARALA